MSETPAIEAERLVKRYGQTRALTGLDLAVPAGMIYGLLGPNGAGKTTAVRDLRHPAAPARRSGAGARPRRGAPGGSGAVRHRAHRPVRGAGRVAHRLGQPGHDRPASWLTGKAARRRADQMLARFDLTSVASRAVRTYSGGMRRRLDLAASLIGGPSVLFLDEPTTGLDPSARAMTWEMVRELAAEGTTVLLTTQYLEEADQLAAASGGHRRRRGHRRGHPARAQVRGRRRAAHGDAGARVGPAGGDRRDQADAGAACGRTRTGGACRSRWPRPRD